MAAEFWAGISVGETTAQLSLIEPHGSKHELVHVEEYPRNGDDDLWFVEPLFSLEKKMISRVSRVSLALGHHLARIHYFPLDVALTQEQQNEHVRWEFSQFFPEDDSSAYVYDLHVIATNEAGQVHDVVAVALKRDYVFRLNDLFTSRHCNLHLVDLHNFAAEQVARVSSANDLNGRWALVDFSLSRLDISLFDGNRAGGLIMRSVTTNEAAVSLLQQLKEEFEMASIMVHGTGLTSELITQLQEQLGTVVVVFNPFSGLNIPRSCKSFKTVAGREHRFAACIGSAIRTS